MYHAEGGCLTFSRAAENGPDYSALAKLLPNRPGISINHEYLRNQHFNNMKDALSAEVSSAVLAWSMRPDSAMLVIACDASILLDLGKVLESRAPALVKKTIMLVGTKVPPSVAGSAAMADLYTALAAVRVMEPGIYVATLGNVYPHNICGLSQAGDFLPKSEINDAVF